MPGYRLEPVAFDPWDSGRSLAPTDIAPLTNVSEAVRGYPGRVASGEILRGATQGGYDPARTPAENAVSPQGIQQAIDIGSGVMGGGLGIRSYHASPHEFAKGERFDPTKIGSGEGSAAFTEAPAGYHAENRAVSQTYYDEFNRQGMPRTPEANAWELINNLGMSKQEVLAHYEKMASSASKQSFWKDAIEAVKSGAVDRYQPPKLGHLYETALDVDPKRLMNWDEPLSNQPAAVRDVASTYKIPEREGSTLITPDQFYERLRAQMPTRTSLEIPGYDAALRRHREGGLAASDVLREAGVPGTRYLDKGSRGVPDTGTSNYAMYDPALVEIRRKLLSAGGLGAGLTAGGAIALGGGEAQAAQPPMQYTWPGPQSQAEPQGYDLQEVDHDPFTPGVQTSGYERVVGEAPKPYPKDVQDFYDFVQSYPQQIPFTPPQAIPTQSWSFGNNAPDATPTRFSDIAPPLNYYQPLSNTNGVPTYGG